MEDEKRRILHLLWLPTRYWDISDDEVRAIVLQKDLDEMLSSKSLFLYGNGLNGVKIAAYLIKREALERKKTAFWLSYFDLREAEKKIFNDEYSVLERAKFVEILVLEGFYEEMMIPFEFRDLVKYRWDWNKKTVIVYSGDVKWFIQRQDKGIMDVLTTEYQLCEVK